MNDFTINDNNKGYNGNVNLKKTSTQIPFTEHQAQELIKCASDPIYFISNYCQIISLDYGTVLFKLFEYQKRFIQTIHENNRVLSMQPRQMGKCVFKDTKYKVRNKITGEIYEVSAKEFHELSKL